MKSMFINNSNLVTSQYKYRVLIKKINLEDKFISLKNAMSQFFEPT